MTLRDETEWLELLQHGCTMLAGSGNENIYHAYCTMIKKDIDTIPKLYGDGKASQKIVDILARVKPKI